MPKNSINYLIVKTAHGDNAAFEELYKEMRKPVYNYALHFCGNPSIAAGYFYHDLEQKQFVYSAGRRPFVDLVYRQE